MRSVTELLVLQPTAFCNIDCDYCYLPSRDNPKRMSDATIAAAFRFLSEGGLLAERVTAVWHAGEPLVLGPEYYRNAFAIARGSVPASVALTHAFQTNGMLLDGAWCAFLREHQASLGISLDGPAELHDARRKTRQRTGTHAAVVRGVRAAQFHGVPFHVIAVLTRASLAEPDRLFDFFADLGVRELAFNIEEVEAANGASSLQFATVEGEFGQFLSRFLRRMRDAGWPFSLREYDGACTALLSGTPGRNHQVEPWRIVSVGVNGEVTTFSPELLGYQTQAGTAFDLGNVNSHGFDQVARSLRFLTMQRDIERGIRLCKEQCAYFEFCGGGAPANKLAELGTLAGAETMFCRLTCKTTLDVVLDLLEDPSSASQGKS